MTMGADNDSNDELISQSNDCRLQNCYNEILPICTFYGILSSHVLLHNVKTHDRLKDGSGFQDVPTIAEGS